MIRRKTIPAIRKARRPSPARSGARSDQRRPRPAAWATRPAMIKASAPAPPIHPSGRPMNTRVAAIAPRSPPHTRRQAPEDRAAAPMPIGSARIRHWAVNAGSPSVVPPRFGGKSEESDEPCWPDRKICRREPSAARAAAIRKERNTSRTAAASLRQRIVPASSRSPAARSSRLQSASPTFTARTQAMAAQARKTIARGITGAATRADSCAGRRNVAMAPRTIAAARITVRFGKLKGSARLEQ